MEEWIKTLRRFARNKKAISGLETAIVLIAFVIVASAFAYAVLNMGFLATQKSQQVVLGGLQAASSALVVDGPVYGYSSQFPTTSPNAQLTTIIFWLKTAQGATAVDMNPGKTTISFQNPRGVWPNIYFCSDGMGNPASAANCPGLTAQGLSYQTPVTFQPSGSTTVYGVDTAATTLFWEVGSGMLLKANDKLRVTVDLSKIGYTATPTTDVGNSGGTNGMINKNDEFVIIVKPPTGSVLDIDRVAPAAVAAVNNLG
jgi:flagellin-like protein